MADGQAPRGSLNLCASNARYPDTGNRGSLPPRSSFFFFFWPVTCQILWGAVSSVSGGCLHAFPIGSGVCAPNLFHPCREWREAAADGRVREWSWPGWGPRGWGNGQLRIYSREAVEGGTTCEPKLQAPGTSFMDHFTKNKLKGKN